MIEIRLVGKNDAALFARVADDVFDAKIDPARLAVYLADPSQAMAVAIAIADGVVIGQARGAVVRNPDEADIFYLDNLGVARGWQRQGIATRLIDALADHARGRGCATMWVGTEPDNRAANALYSRRATMQPIAYYEWQP